MTRQEFDSKSFEELMEMLNEESYDITMIDVLKDFIKEKIDSDDFHLAIYLLQAIWDDPNIGDSKWYQYDYSMGTLQSPISLNCKEDIEHMIED